MTDEPNLTAEDVEAEAPEVFEEARVIARSGSVRLLEQVAELVGQKAGAKAVFGDPIEQNGRIVVPVAQTIIGAGAGSGESEETGSGSGAGSGALTRPIGFIEIREHETEFVPLRRPWLDGGLLVAASFSAFLAAKAVSKLLRG
jgi:hypothetical protein